MLNIATLLTNKVKISLAKRFLGYVFSRYKNKNKMFERYQKNYMKSNGFLISNTTIRNKPIYIIFVTFRYKYQ